MKILFVASEAAPFIKTGGLGDVIAALPRALAARGHDVLVVLPRYGAIDATPQFRRRFMRSRCKPIEARSTTS